MGVDGVVARIHVEMDAMMMTAKNLQGIIRGMLLFCFVVAVRNRSGHLILDLLPGVLGLESSVLICFNVVVVVVVVVVGSDVSGCFAVGTRGSRIEGRGCCWRPWRLFLFVGEDGGIIPGNLFFFDGLSK
jgi:hypothetical protein